MIWEADLADHNIFLDPANHGHSGNFLIYGGMTWDSDWDIFVDAILHGTDDDAEETTNAANDQTEDDVDDEDYGEYEDKNDGDYVPADDDDE